jgi:hypothetical protein
MKINIKWVILVVIFTGMMESQRSYAQQWGGEKEHGLLTDWSVSISNGLISYFGDLSIYDLKIIPKLSKESGNAYSIMLEKNFWGNSVCLSGQIMKGNLKGMNKNISFRTSLLEYNLQLRADIIGLVMPGKSCHFGIIAYCGAGQLLYTVEKAVLPEGSDGIKVYRPDKPEFVFLAGSDLNYKINRNLGVFAGLALRRCNTDRLDDYRCNGDFDYYTYLDFGISYYISTLKRGVIKNKAQLANSMFRFIEPPHKPLR